MKRSNLWVIGILTTAITTFGLTKIFGTPYWKPNRHPGHFWRYEDGCDHNRSADSISAGKYNQEETPVK